MVSPDGVAPSRMIGVSASVNLRLHYKVQKFSSGTGSPGWSRKRAVKRLWCGVVGLQTSPILSTAHIAFKLQQRRPEPEQVGLSPPPPSATLHFNH